MKDQEKVRLLLIDGTKETRAANISNGVGNVLGKWPSYVASAIWCAICAVSLLILISVLAISFLLNERFMRLHKLNDVMVSQKLENEFCKRATNRDNHIAGRSVMQLANPETLIQDTSENLFYALTKPLDKRQACGVESVLRLCPDKLIYLMHFGGNTYRDSSRFETMLKRSYSNLNEIRADGPNYVKASPFEGSWKNDSASVLAANILTIWQFGGTALSPNLILTNRNLLDTDTPNCMIDREIIFCPEQCSPYIYELISTLNKDMQNKRNNSTERVIDSSIAEFCGSSDYARTGCAGVTRIDHSLMCTTNANHCLFIRSDKWSNNDNKWKENAEQYCPEIMKSFSNNH